MQEILRKFDYNIKELTKAIKYNKEVFTFI